MIECIVIGWEPSFFGWEPCCFHPTLALRVSEELGEKRSERKRELSRTTEDPATAPNPTHSAGEAVAPVRGHGCLDHFQRLEEELLLAY